MTGPLQSSNALRVLIIDRDRSMADMMVVFLADRGFVANAPRTADSAIDHIEEHGADLLLLEPQFGGADDIARAADTAGLTLVLLDAAPIRFSRPPHLLQKPFSGRQLIDLLRQIQTRRQEPVPEVKPPATVAPAAASPAATPPRAPVKAPTAAPQRATLTVVEPTTQEQTPPPAAARGGRGEGHRFNPFAHQDENVQLDLDALTDTSRSRSQPARPARRSHSDFDHPTIQTQVIRLGNLESVPFATIIYKVFASRSSGVLDVIQGELVRRVFVRNGVPVYASSDAPSEQLDSILVKQSILSLPDLQRARRHQAQRTLSETLLALNMITTDQLLLALDRQVFERIMACFGLRTGNFTFEQETHTAWSAQVQQFPQNVVELIFEGTRRHENPNTIARDFGARFNQFVVPTSRFEAFRPYLPEQPALTTLVAQLDGQKTVHQLTQSLKLPPMEVLTQLHALSLAHMIEMSELPAAKPQQSDSLVPSALRSDQRAARIIKGNMHQAQDTFERHVLGMYTRLEHRSPELLLGVDADADSRTLDEALQRALDGLTPPRGQLLPAPIAEKLEELRGVLEDAHRRLKRRRKSGPSLPPGQPAELASSLLPQSFEPHQHDIPKPTPRGETAPLASPPPAAPAPPLAELQTPPAKAPPRPKRPQAPLPNGVHYAAPERLASITLRKDHEEQLVDVGHQLDLALASIVAGDWHAAYRHIERVDSEQDVNARVVVIKAWIVYNLPYENKQRQARICRDRLQFALTLDAAIPEGYYYLGRIAEDAGEPAEAVRCYEFALRLSPGFLDASRRVTALSPHLGQRGEAGEGFIGKLKGWWEK